MKSFTSLVLSLFLLLSVAPALILADPRPRPLGSPGGSPGGGGGSSSSKAKGASGPGGPGGGTPIGLGSSSHLPQGAFRHVPMRLHKFDGYAACYPDKDALYFNEGNYVRVPKKLGKDACGAKIEVTAPNGQQAYALVADFGAHDGLELSPTMFESFYPAKKKEFFGEYRFYQ